jgi:hypothetical protein
LKSGYTAQNQHKKTAVISANQLVLTELHNAAELNPAGILAVSIKLKKDAARWKWFQNLISHPNTRRGLMRKLSLPDFIVNANL